MTAPVLSAVSLVKQFGPVRAVDGLSFDVARGEVFALLGPNGAGKTTTLRMLLGILRPDRGEVRYALDGPPRWPSASQVGYLPEERGLFREAPVGRTVAYFGVLRGARHPARGGPGRLRRERGGEALRGEAPADRGGRTRRGRSSLLPGEPLRLAARPPEVGRGMARRAGARRARRRARARKRGRDAAREAASLLAGGDPVAPRRAVATAEAEQVVAAIRPQTWVDGKILGLSALTLVLLFLYVGPPAVAFGLLRRLDADLPALPAAAADPGLLAALVVFAGLGFLLWFTFFAAVAATVDDPNNSSRGGWLMLPLLPLGLAFAVVRDPDTLLARVLGLLPPTAPAVMPVRMLLTEVAAWEVLLAVALLASSIALLRRAAVKVFHLGMLMYGKEPTWREIWRRVRETG